MSAHSTRVISRREAIRIYKDMCSVDFLTNSELEDILDRVYDSHLINFRIVEDEQDGSK